MKRISTVLLFLILCAGIAGCGGKIIADDISGPVVFYDFATVHAKRTADPSTETVLRVTIGFLENSSMRREIELREADLKLTIAEFGSDIVREDLTDVERYEKLRKKLQEKLNEKLSRGGIVKVLFREINIK